MGKRNRNTLINLKSFEFLLMGVKQCLCFDCHLFYLMGMVLYIGLF